MRDWKVLFEENYWGSHCTDTYEESVPARESEDGDAMAIPGNSDCAEEKAAVCTVEHRINKTVEWYDESWKLLSLYTCSKGLVLDYCKKIDPQELQEFMERFQSAGFDGDNFDDRLFERLQVDNPTAPHVHVKLMRQGEELSSKGRSCIAYTPVCVENQENDPVSLLCLAHYGLDTRYAWHFCRAHYLWDDGREGDLSDLTAVLDEMEVTVPGESFHLTGEPQKIPLIHAVSGEHFDLCIEAVEKAELEPETMKLLGEDMICPTHYESVCYYTNPALSEDSYFLKACAKGDQPVIKKASETAAASVSIIGGSSGPTAVFLAGKGRGETVQKKSVCSPLFFEPVPVRDWYICYHFKRREPLALPLNVSEP